MGKVKTMTRLPKNPTTFLISLRRIFGWLASAEKKEIDISIETLTEWIGENVGWEKSSDQAANFVKTVFLRNNRNGRSLKLSEWANLWMGIGDPDIQCDLLFERLSENVFFFEELLPMLKEARTADDLLDYLKENNPQFNWNTSGLIEVRLDWLLACNKIHKRGALYSLIEVVKHDRDKEIRDHCEKLDLGELGELLVLDREKTELAKVNPKLAERVRRVSTYAPRAGYDIQSYFPDGRLKFIEVKTTAGDKPGFDITDNEWQVARSIGEAYFICRVTGVRTENQAVTYIQDPTRKLNRVPLVWRIAETDRGKPIMALSESEEKSQMVLLERTEMKNILADLPRTRSIQSVDHRGRIIENTMIVNWLYEYEFEYLNCYLCGREEGEGVSIRIESKSRRYVGEQWRLCTDCFLRLREFLW